MTEISRRRRQDAVGRAGDNARNESDSTRPPADPVDSFPTRGRVAICFAGLARTFVLRDLRDNIRRALIEPLEGRADVFMVVREPTRNESEYWLGMNDAWQAYWRNVTLAKDDVQTSIESMNPTAYEHTRLHFADQDTYFNGMPGGRAGCRTRLFNMWYDMQTCWRMIQRHERFAGFRYDWYVRARPDVSYGAAFPAAARWPSMARNAWLDRDGLFVRTYDIFAVMTRDVARSVMHGIADDLSRNCNATFLAKGRNNEYHFELAGATAARHHLQMPVQPRIARPCETKGRWTDIAPGGRRAFEKFCVAPSDWRQVLPANVARSNDAFFDRLGDNVSFGLVVDDV